MFQIFDQNSYSLNKKDSKMIKEILSKNISRYSGISTWKCALANVLIVLKQKI